MRCLCAIIAVWMSAAACAGSVRAYTPTRWIGDAVAVPVRKSSRKRHDAGAYPLTPEWQELAGSLVLPPHADTVDFTVFSWRQPNARWEIKDFKLVND